MFGGRWVLAEADRVEQEAAKLSDPEEQTKLLNSLQLRVQRRVTEEWWKLADELIVRRGRDLLGPYSDDRFGIMMGITTSPMVVWTSREVFLNQSGT